MTTSNRQHAGFSADARCVSDGAPHRIAARIADGALGDAAVRAADVRPADIRADGGGEVSAFRAFDASCSAAGGFVADASRARFRRLDARVSVVIVLAYSVALFFVDTWAGMAAFASALAASAALARVPAAKLAKSLVPLSFILAFTIIAHIPQGLDEGLFYALRILLLAAATLALAFSYDDAHFVRAFSSFLRPLRALRIPIDDIAMMFSIALRFIPASMDEFSRIAAAQRCRGARLDDGGAIARMRRWGNVFVPMLVGLFRRAGLLAQAMEARCYGCAARRSSLHGDERLRASEIALALAAAAALAVCAALL